MSSPAINPNEVFMSRISSMLMRVIVRSLVMLSLLCSTDGFMFGQNTNAGEIRGTVTDAAGGVIPGVTVSIVNIDTGVKRELVTNDAGIFDAVSLVPGSYSLSFSKEGFTRLRRDGVVLHYGVITVDAQLAVGSRST